ncbi:MAG: hypothetical protein J6U54_13220 [Clostridiales bacterium]|nr:hypothetical protein [Clostridiales bacterium]
MPSFTNVIDIDLTEATSDYKVECHKEVHQWDQGVVLHFTGVTIPNGSTCQFDTKNTTYNFLVDNSTSTCKIPNSVLGEELNGDVKAHLHVLTADYGIVIYDIHIPVVRRVKPASYVADPDDPTVESFVYAQAQKVEDFEEETFTFVLSDNSTVTKTLLVKAVSS